MRGGRGHALHGWETLWGLFRFCALSQAPVNHPWGKSSGSVQVLQFALTGGRGFVYSFLEARSVAPELSHKQGPLSSTSVTPLPLFGVTFGIELQGVLAALASAVALLLGRVRPLSTFSGEGACLPCVLPIRTFHNLLSTAF